MIFVKHSGKDQILSMNTKDEKLAANIKHILKNLIEARLAKSYRGSL